MAIPDYETIMFPLLKAIQDGKEHRFRDVVQSISNEFNLAEDERNEEVTKSGQPLIANRTGWARLYLKKAGLIEDPRRGYMKITERGVSVLKEAPEKIDNEYLKQFPEFQEFRSIKKEEEPAKTEIDEKVEKFTPDELIESGFREINTNLAQEILEKIRENPPRFFENLVLKLLSEMGYGEGKVTGKSGDGGIDGIITQDKLGLDTIFFQAKRYNEKNVVGASTLRDFIGSLDLKGGNKGVFITTSRFARDSEETIKGSHKSIVLIDGIKLAKLMIEFDVGVYTEKNYKKKKIDSDFFEEDYL